MIQTIKLQKNITECKGNSKPRYSITIPLNIIKQLKYKKGMILRIGIVHDYIKIIQ